MRTLVGLGGVPSLPKDDNTGNLVLTTEVGGHPLTGALGTGVSISSTEDLKGLWSVVTPGIFAKLDLTYLFLSGLWACDPPPHFPLRIQMGSRLGLGISESFRASADVPVDSPYTLLRPELQSTLDFEMPLGGDRVYSLIARAAIDAPVNVSEVFRWSFSFGLGYGWGR